MVVPTRYSLLVSLLFIGFCFPGTVICKGCPDDELSDLRYKSMVKNNWNFDFTMPFYNNNSVGNKCATPGNWYGWSPKNLVGTLSATFQGTGVATLDFGNCWNSGVVNVYLDDIVIATAPAGHKRVKKTFYYTNDTVLKIKDEGPNSVIGLNSFTFKCDEKGEWNTVSKMGELCSDLGKTPLGDVEECRSVETWGHEFKKVENEQGWPKGCYVANNGLVYFNNHHTGSANWGARQICAKETMPCYTPSTNNDMMLCANGKFGKKWNGCIDQGSVRVKCPKGSVPCNDLAKNGEEFSCEINCAEHGGEKNCKKLGCRTIGGPSSNSSCIFPFILGGKTYSSCAYGSDGYFCSTKVDSQGNHIRGEGNWGFCDPLCPKSACTTTSCCGSATIWDIEWKNLIPEQQKAWLKLGWDEKSWNNNAVNKSSQAFCWTKLSKSQSDAALTLCYDENKWNGQMKTDFNLACGDNSGSTRINSSLYYLSLAIGLKCFMIH